jgi:hypothetical protein
MQVLTQRVLNNESAVPGGVHTRGRQLTSQLVAAAATTASTADSLVGTRLLVPATVTGFANGDVICIANSKQAPASVKRSDGGVFTDLTTAAGNATANDVPFYRASPAVNDALYIGSGTPRMGVEFSIGTAASGAVLTSQWEYWNGSAWAVLTTSGDETNNLRMTSTGTKFLGIPPPTDWASVTVDSQAAYWIRSRITAFTSLATVPLGTQLWVYGSSRLEWQVIGLVSTVFSTRSLLDYTHTNAQADAIRNQAEQLTPLWLTGGSLWEVIFDYLAETTGEPMIVQAMAQTYDFDTDQT